MNQINQIQFLLDEIEIISKEIEDKTRLLHLKQNSITELRKALLYDNLNSYVEELDCQIIDFNESDDKIFGCYFLHKNEEIVYVGISVDINKRLKKHKANKYKDFNQVKYIACNDYLNAIKIESYYIDKFKPKYNSDLGEYIKRAIIHNYNLIDDKINYGKGWPDKPDGETPRSKYTPRIRKHWYH